MFRSTVLVIKIKGGMLQLQLQEQPLQPVVKKFSKQFQMSLILVQNLNLILLFPTHTILQQ